MYVCTHTHTHTHIFCHSQTVITAHGNYQFQVALELLSIPKENGRTYDSTNYINSRRQELHAVNLLTTW